MFAHAGIRPGVRLEGQEEAGLLWMSRDARSGLELRGSYSGAWAYGGAGATAAAGTHRDRHRGCFATGVLAVLRLVAGEEPRFLSAGHVSERGSRRATSRIALRGRPERKCSRHF